MSTENFEVDGLVKQREELEKLLMSNPAMEKKVQGIVRKVLQEVRSAMGKAARSSDVMKSDPRQAYKAVKSSVYKQILGGSVSILNKRGKVNRGSYEPEKTLRARQRGGNRRPRSQRTDDLMSIIGNSRGMVLRFLNDGTGSRHVRFMPDSHREMVKRGSQGGNVKKYGRTVNTGRRGAIRARNWFGPRSRAEMGAAARNIERLIAQLVQEQFG